MNQGELLGDSPSAFIGSIILGIFILTNRPKAMVWARFAIIAGAVIFTIAHIFAQDYVMAFLQIFFSLSLIGLIFGNPQKIRISLCTTFICLFFILEIIGIQSEMTGKNLLGKALITATQSLKDIENGIVTGHDELYQLNVTDNNWKSRPEEDLKKDNPVADIWLVNPEYDAHIMTIQESVADSMIFELASLTDAVIDNAETAVENFTVISTDPVTLQSGLIGNTMVATGSINSYEVKYRYGIFALNNFALQIVCFTVASTFEHVDKDFESVISSLMIDRDKVYPSFELVNQTVQKAL